MGTTHDDLETVAESSPRLFHSKLSAEKAALHWKMGRKVGNTFVPVESRNSVVFEILPINVTYEIPE